MFLYPVFGAVYCAHDYTHLKLYTFSHVDMASHSVNITEECRTPERIAHPPTMDAEEDAEALSLKHQSRRLNSVPSENGGGGTTLDHNKYSPRSNRSAGGEDNNINTSQSASTSRTPVKKAATISTDNNTVDDGEHHHQQRLQDVSPAKKLQEGTTATESAGRRQCKYCEGDPLSRVYATSLWHQRRDNDYSN